MEIRKCDVPRNPSHLDSQDGEYVEVGGLMSYQPTILRVSGVPLSM
jgi:hypothetical protein